MRALADHVGEIASRLDFKTIQHFSRVFKEETAQRPRHYRNTRNAT